MNTCMLDAHTHLDLLYCEMREDRCLEGNEVVINWAGEGQGVGKLALCPLSSSNRQAVLAWVL